MLAVTMTVVAGVPVLVAVVAVMIVGMFAVAVTMAVAVTVAVAVSVAAFGRRYVWGHRENDGGKGSRTGNDDLAIHGFLP